MYIKEESEYEKLYSLDVLGVEDRAENDQSEVLSSFKESITRGVDGRYEVSVSWIPSSSLSDTNELPCRRRLIRIEKRLNQNPKLKEEYEKRIAEVTPKSRLETVPSTCYTNQLLGRARVRLRLEWFSMLVRNHTYWPTV